MSRSVLMLGMWRYDEEEGSETLPQNAYNLVWN